MRDEGCKGYSEFNGEGTDYECEYEFSGEVTCDECIFGSCGGKFDPRIDPHEDDDEETPPDTITLKRIYSTHCQVCGRPFKTVIEDTRPFVLVYFVPLDNNICCWYCTDKSGLPYEPRIYKEGE